jgi:hypothetical protein
MTLEVAAKEGDHELDHSGLEVGLHEKLVTAVDDREQVLRPLQRKEPSRLE